MSAKYRWLVLVILLLLAGCQASPTLTAIPPAVPIQVQITPLLEHWLPDMNRCALDMQGSNLVVQVEPPSRLNVAQQDLVVRLGAKSGSEPHLSVLGYETIRVIVHPQVPVDRLTLQELQSLLTGDFQNWADLPSLSEAGLNNAEPVSILLSERDSELSAWVNQYLLPANRESAAAYTGLLPQSLQESVNQTPGSLTILLESLLLPESKALDILDENDKLLKWELPVLAVTRELPKGDLEQLLLCLQQAGEN